MPSATPKSLLAFLLLGYIVLVAAIVGGMFWWRHSVLSDETVQESQANWDQWKSIAAKDDGLHSPVQRTMPKSEEPPMLVLMRGYFPACVAGLIVPLTALYAFIAWLACGIMRSARTELKPPRRGDAERI